MFLVTVPLQLAEAQRQPCCPLSTEAMLDALVTTTALSCREHDECVSVLAGLRLWHSQHLQGGLQGYLLNPVFKENLKMALLGG